jgi:hypothetical protein
LSIKEIDDWWQYVRIDMHLSFILVHWLVCCRSASLSNHCLIRRTHSGNCCRHVLADIVLKPGCYWLHDSLAI